MIKIKQEISKNTLQIMLKLLFTLMCFFILLFPEFAYKIGIKSRIFPAMEIIFIYYFMTLYSLNMLGIFFIGLLLDQVTAMPFGTNSLVFLLAYIIFRLCSRFFASKNYLANFIIFCVYCLFILNFKYLLITFKNFEVDGYLTIFLQYLTTIFSYNLVCLLLDYPISYFKEHAKQKNTA
ncbi:MAG: hypothetical protein ACIPMY_01485 [Rickettsia endosymbiont of Pentastiridius leporinus]